jgi:hypothetical protein
MKVTCIACSGLLHFAIVHFRGRYELAEANARFRRQRNIRCKPSITGCAHFNVREDGDRCAGEIQSSLGRNVWLAGGEGRKVEVA